MNKRSTASVCVLLALILLFSACGASQTPAPGIPEDPAPAGSPVPDAAEEPVSGENTAPGTAESTHALYPDAHVILLGGHAATLDGEAVEEFDYTWHCDPGTAHDEVKNAPAEYYTGTKPETDAAAYIDSELYYYPVLPEDGFKRVNYDGETEWAYYYTDGENEDYIFATLPVLGNSLPAQMMHSETEAADNRVLHITQPGEYLLSGEWDGQIRVELGDADDCFADPEKRVTLILCGVNVNCTVAPGVLFYSAYECDNTWEAREEYGFDADTSDAGVTVILADGSENTVSGTNVFRMLKTKYKDEDSTAAVKTQKKMRKTDAAFYSYVTMNICGGDEGSGTLTVNSGFEGLDSELHLNILGGHITVNSQDDGINVNEDYVSVVRFTGGEVTLNPAQGAEGDGVDSNGYIVIDGGTLTVNGVVPPDSALDSESGILYNSGTVVIDGETQTYTPGETFRESGGGPGMGGPGGFGGGRPDDFGGDPGMGGFGADFDIREFKKEVASLGDDATLDDVLALLGLGGFGGDMGGGMRPDGQEPPEFGGGFSGEAPGGMGGFGGGQPPELPAQGVR